jgi:hypothetical protein
MVLSRCILIQSHLHQPYTIIRTLLNYYRYSLLEIPGNSLGKEASVGVDRLQLKHDDAHDRQSDRQLHSFGPWKPQWRVLPQVLAPCQTKELHGHAMAGLGEAPVPELARAGAGAQPLISNRLGASACRGDHQPANSRRQHAACSRLMAGADLF